MSGDGSESDPRDGAVPPLPDPDGGGAEAPGKQHADPFAAALAALGARLLGALAALEHASRGLHPQGFGAIRERLIPFRTALATAWTHFEGSHPPQGLAGLVAELGTATQHALAALDALIGPELHAGSAAGGGTFATPDAAVRVLGGMHHHHLAEAVLYPLRRALPPVNRFFLEAPVRGRANELDPEAPALPGQVGLHRAAGDAQGRGGFLFYVPESYDGARAWPLVVALHGGSGHGDDFLWLWMREARSRRFLLLAPTSRGSTWSMHAPAIDTQALHAMVDAVSARVAVDPARILLTGLSDGATFTLIAGLQEASPFGALAPVSGVLHPRLLADPQTRARLRGRRIYLVHGALDWMFPVALARGAAQRLEDLGADLVYREIADLSHTYPREENDRILCWFDPDLALPTA